MYRSNAALHYLLEYRLADAPKGVTPRATLAQISNLLS